MGRMGDHLADWGSSTYHLNLLKQWREDVSLGKYFSLRLYIRVCQITCQNCYSTALVHIDLSWCGCVQETRFRTNWGKCEKWEQSKSDWNSSTVHMPKLDGVV